MADDFDDPEVDADQEFDPDDRIAQLEADLVRYQAALIEIRDHGHTFTNAGVVQLARATLESGTTLAAVDPHDPHHTGPSTRAKSSSQE